MEDTWTLKRTVSEVIGAGPKSSEDMDYAQATESFRELLLEEPHPVTVGAYLLANRWKKNTAEELAAFIDVMRMQSVCTIQPSVRGLDIGANYDGKKRTAHLGIVSGLIAAAAGIPIAVHSGDRYPTKYGFTHKHVLDSLGISTQLSSEESVAMLNHMNFGFYFQPSFNPKVHGLLEYRENMGVRTVINTIETLANPSNARTHLGGFYHLAFAKKKIEAMQSSETLHFKRIVLVQGLEGSVDIRPDYTKVVEWNQGEITDFDLKSTEFGFSFTRENLQVNNLPEDSARLTREILSGICTDHFQEAALLNAAVKIYAYQKGRTLSKCLEKAEETLQSGKPENLLNKLRGWNNVKTFENRKAVSDNI